MFTLPGCFAIRFILILFFSPNDESEDEQDDEAEQHKEP